jgi:CHAD domain-containing protein
MDVSMAYRLEADELVSEGIRRLILECVDQAIDDLTHPEKDQNEAIHDTRKLCKRIRAAFRLIRGEIGGNLYQQLDVRFRDVSRLLSSARDSWVMIETFDRLVDWDALELPDNIFADIRPLLVERDRANRILALRGGETILQVVRTFREARPLIENITLQRDEFFAICWGIRRVYARGRKGMESARAQATPENYHEWRKRAKYLWHHIEILVNLWPALLTVLADELHSLSDFLGESHDLSELRCVVTGEFQGLVREKGINTLVARIDQKRSALDTEAQLLGQRIFADPPKVYVRRLGSYWETWRGEN